MLEKELETDAQGNTIFDPDGKQRYRCGFRIGGGIDQDPSQSPQGYPDKVLFIDENHSKNIFKNILFLLTCF